MPAWEEILCNLTDIRLTPDQLERFSIYEGELLDWNARVNLTAIREAEGVRLRHFVDSLVCARAFPDGPPASLVDVGTGAGFPGLPLKILWPDMQLTLVESVGKKLRFCEHLVEKLGLEGVSLINARAETIGQDPAHRERYQAAVGRAVAPLPVLAEFLLPLVRPGGLALMPRGSDTPQEAEAATGAIRKLGGDPGKLLPIQIPGVEGQRYLLVLNKKARTPALYPRLPGTPAKNPLS